MTQTLVNLKKTTTPKANTPFLEESGKGRGVLGNARWQTPPSLPSRQRCQKDVVDTEREDGAAIIAEYREQEQIARDNDLGARQHELNDTNPCKQITAVRRQELHKELLVCDHVKFEAAQHALAHLRVEAAELPTKIFTRLIGSFDAELQEVAIAAEARLTEAGIPLSSPAGDDWELWHSIECTWRHSWREVARHKLQQFDHSSADIAIFAVQWLYTDEEGVLFHWL